jgi:hypothetical protein
MNIFYLDKDPRVAAEYHCDKHVVKMILESAQLLSGAHRILDGQKIEKKWVLNDSRENILYGVSHINHPSAIWTRSNIDHYRYLYELFVFLIDEYKYRYNNKTHKCETLLEPLFPCPYNIDYEAPWSDPPQAMPEECRIENNSVQAYRNYYIKHKYKFAKWTRREIPSWYIVTENKNEQVLGLPSYP